MSDGRFTAGEGAPCSLGIGTGMDISPSRDEIEARRLILGRELAAAVMPEGIRLWGQPPVLLRYGGVKSARPVGLMCILVAERAVPGDLFKTQHYTYGFDPESMSLGDAIHSFQQELAKIA